MTRYLTLSLLLLCASCAPVTAGASVPLSSPQASPVLLTATQFVTPTETPSPTVDYQATTNAAQATSDYTRLQAVQIAATASEAAATRTQAAFGLALTSDESNRAAGATSQSIRATQAVIEATRTADGEAMAIAAPTIIAAMTAATFTQAHEVTGFVFNGIAALIALAAVLVAVAWSVAKLRQPVDVNVADGWQPIPPEPVERAVNTVAPGVYDLDTVPPGDPAKFGEFCRYALSGSPLGSVAVVGAGVYGSYSQYNPVRDWLKKKEYILLGADGAGSLSKSGKEFCHDWMAASSSPVPPDGQK